MPGGLDRVMTLSSLTRAYHVELTGAAATAVVAGMIGVLFAGSTLLTPLYIMYEQRFGFSKITLTLVYAAYVLGNLGALLLFGKASDIAGRRVVALAGIAASIVSALVFLFAQGIASLYIGRILSGLGIGVGAGTGTAWLAELIAAKDQGRASTVATSTNFFGLGLGALAAGLLAQYAPLPLQLPFIVYLAALFAAAALVWRTHETVAGRPLREVPLRPQLSVPRALRAQFVPPAVTGFASMALVGFYAALAPSILANDLHETSHAVAGALFFELAIVVSACIVVTQKVPSRTAMLSALALMPPSVALLVAAQLLASMDVMLVATACCGVAAGLGYRGSLQVVNQIAPQERRAEVMSSYFVCAFCGNALPVIGVGVIGTMWSAAAASIVFAAVIAAFALAALGFGLRHAKA